MAEPFELSWRTTTPVLDYTLRGFWSVEDGQAWVAAVRKALESKPSGRWYMCGDLTELKAQKEEVNELRNEVTKLTAAAGLAGCVMVSSLVSSKLQLKRLLDAAAKPEIYRYVSSRDEAEAELSRMLAS